MEPSSEYNKTTTAEKVTFVDAIDVCCTASLVCLCAGIFFFTAGLVIPTQYTFDPQLPARRMEAIEVYYDKMSFAVDICVVVGMSFATSGGFLLLVAVVAMAAGGEIQFRDVDSEMERVSLNSRRSSAYGDYGATPNCGANYGANMPNYGVTAPNYGGVPPNYGCAMPNYGGAMPTYGGAIPNYGGAMLNDLGK